MHENKKNASLLNKSSVKVYLTASIIATVIFWVLSCLFAFINMKINSLNDKLTVLAYASLIFSSLICGIISAKIKYVKGIISGCFGAIFLLIELYIILAIFTGFNFSLNAILIIPIVIIFSAIGAVIKKNI